MATLPTSPTDKTAPRPPRPKLPLLQLKSFSSDMGSPMSPCSTPRSNSTWMERRQSAWQLVNQQNISPIYFHVPVSSYIFKLLQLIVTIVCTGAYSEGVMAIKTSTSAQMFPYFVCSTYMIITPVILISYVLGHRMPEILVRIFNTLAGILFLLAGAIALQYWRLFRDKRDNNAINLERNAKFLLATGVLCLANSLIYLADVARSVHMYLAEP